MSDDMNQAPLVGRLIAHGALGGVPREQFEWLTRVGQARTVQPGEILIAAGKQRGGLFMIFDGYSSIHVDRGSVWRIAAAVGEGAAAIFSIHQYLRRT